MDTRHQKACSAPTHTLLLHPHPYPHPPVQDCSIPAGTCHRWTRDNRRPAQHPHTPPSPIPTTPHLPVQDCSILAGTCHRWTRGTRRPAQHPHTPSFSIPTHTHTHQSRTVVSRQVLVTDGTRRPAQHPHTPSFPHPHHTPTPHLPVQDCSIPAGTCHRWTRDTRRPVQLACASTTQRRWGPGPGSNRQWGCEWYRLSAPGTGPLACKDKE